MSSADALTWLRAMLGPQAVFRPGQQEAIDVVTLRRQRALLVQRTGWGKSVVYFLATKLLRAGGSGPTLLVSPLLSLMRNQVAMATRIGVRAHTINCENRSQWEQVEAGLRADTCDLLLISPERLNNEHFQNDLLSAIAGRIGLFVVDEAHCISDWGHDFRPDYRRIVRILQALPRGVPLLATTATANDRVVADVAQQLGPGLVMLRGPLGRPSLRLQNLNMADQGQRLAWLAENVPKFPGSGIVYCLTVADTERVAKWLKAKGMAAEAYHADLASEERVKREEGLVHNQLKALVATVALGMGYDKPDLSFVIHFQRPGSVVTYYQQVGRAGRAIARAYGILLSGQEDDDIQNYFIDSAFPPADRMVQILAALAASDGLSLTDLLARLNIARSVADKALKLLEVDGAVGIDRADRKVRYFRTPKPWSPDHERIARVQALRRQELMQMQAYVRHQGCLMEFLVQSLDGPDAGPCGVCANCQKRGFTAAVAPAKIAQALEFLRRDDLPLNPKRRWPAGLFSAAGSGIPREEQNELGRALSYYGDAGWGKLVRQGKYLHQHFGDDLVQAAAELIAKCWRPEPRPEWLTSIPSRRHPRLVADFAARLAASLGLPFTSVLTCNREAAEQKTMANSTMQACNLKDVLAIGLALGPGPVLLVDDIVDSGWTMTMAGWLLRKHGSGPVYPFALARATARKY